MNDEPSILSHEERAVAAALAAGTDPVTIADERDSSVTEIEATVDRIREKTERAFATLAESPFTNDLVDDLDPDRRAALRAALDDD
jgi:hypothetical protein